MAGENQRTYAVKKLDAESKLKDEGTALEQYSSSEKATKESSEHFSGAGVEARTISRGAKFVDKDRDYTQQREAVIRPQQAGKIDFKSLQNRPKFSSNRTWPSGKGSPQSPSGKCRSRDKGKRSGKSERGNPQQLYRLSITNPRSNPTIGIAYPQQKVSPPKKMEASRGPVSGSYRFHVPSIPEREAELQQEELNYSRCFQETSSNVTSPSYTSQLLGTTGGTSIHQLPPQQQQPGPTENNNNSQTSSQLLFPDFQLSGSNDWQSPERTFNGGISSQKSTVLKEANKANGSSVPLLFQYGYQLSEDSNPDPFACDQNPLSQGYIDSSSLASSQVTHNSFSFQSSGEVKEGGQNNTQFNSDQPEDRSSYPNPPQLPQYLQAPQGAASSMHCPRGLSEDLASSESSGSSSQPSEKGKSALPDSMDTFCQEDNKDAALASGSKRSCPSKDVAAAKGSVKGIHNPASSSTCSSLSPASTSPVNLSEDRQISKIGHPPPFYPQHQVKAQVPTDHLSTNSHHFHSDASRNLPYTPERAKDDMMSYLHNNGHPKPSMDGNKGYMDGFGVEHHPPPPPYSAHQMLATSLATANLDQLDVLLTCKQCDQNFTNLAAFLGHKQYCGQHAFAQKVDDTRRTPGSSTQFHNDMIKVSSSGTSLCQSVSMTRCPSDLHLSLLGLNKNGELMSDSEIKGDSKDDPMKLNLFSGVGNLPVSLPDLEIEDAKLDSLITEALNGLGYQSDNAEIDSSFIDAFADDDLTTVKVSSNRHTLKTKNSMVFESKSKQSTEDDRSLTQGKHIYDSDIESFETDNKHTESKLEKTSLNFEQEEKMNIKKEVSHKNSRITTGEKPREQENKVKDIRKLSKGEEENINTPRFLLSSKFSERCGVRSLQNSYLSSGSTSSQVSSANRSSPTQRIAARESKRKRTGTWSKELIHKIVQQKNKLNKLHVKGTKNLQFSLVMERLTPTVPNPMFGEYDYVSDSDDECEPVKIASQGRLSQSGHCKYTYTKECKWRARSDRDSAAWKHESKECFQMKKTEESPEKPGSNQRLGRRGSRSSTSSEVSTSVSISSDSINSPKSTDHTDSDWEKKVEIRRNDSSEQRTYERSPQKICKESSTQLALTFTKSTKSALMDEVCLSPTEFDKPLTQKETSHLIPYHLEQDQGLMKSPLSFDTSSMFGDLSVAGFDNGLYTDVPLHKEGFSSLDTTNDKKEVFSSSSFLSPFLEQRDWGLMVDVTMLPDEISQYKDNSDKSNENKSDYNHVPLSLPDKIMDYRANLNSYMSEDELEIKRIVTELENQLQTAKLSSPPLLTESPKQLKMSKLSPLLLDDKSENEDTGLDMGCPVQSMSSMPSDPHSQAFVEPGLPWSSSFEFGLMEGHHTPTHAVPSILEQFSEKDDCEHSMITTTTNVEKEQLQQDDHKDEGMGVDKRTAIEKSEEILESKTYAENLMKSLEVISDSIFKNDPITPEVEEPNLTSPKNPEHLLSESQAPSADAAEKVIPDEANVESTHFELQPPLSENTELPPDLEEIVSLQPSESIPYNDSGSEFKDMPIRNNVTEDSCVIETDNCSNTEMDNLPMTKETCENQKLEDCGDEILEAKSALLEHTELPHTTIDEPPELPHTTTDEHTELLETSIDEHRGLLNSSIDEHTELLDTSIDEHTELLDTTIDEHQEPKEPVEDISFNTKSVSQPSNGSNLAEQEMADNLDNTLEEVENASKELSIDVQSNSESVCPSPSANEQAEDSSACVTEEDSIESDTTIQDEVISYTIPFRCSTPENGIANQSTHVFMETVTDKPCSPLLTETNTEHASHRSTFSNIESDDESTMLVIAEHDSDLDSDAHMEHTPEEKAETEKEPECEANHRQIENIPDVEDIQEHIPLHLMAFSQHSPCKEDLQMDERLDSIPDDAPPSSPVLPASPHTPVENPDTQEQEQSQPITCNTMDTIPASIHDTQSLKEENCDDLNAKEALHIDNTLTIRAEMDYSLVSPPQLDLGITKGKISSTEACIPSPLPLTIATEPSEAMEALTKRVSVSLYDFKLSPLNYNYVPDEPPQLSQFEYTPISPANVDEDEPIIKQSPKDDCEPCDLSDDTALTSDKIMCDIDLSDDTALTSDKIMCDIDTELPMSPHHTAKLSPPDESLNKSSIQNDITFPFILLVLPSQSTAPSIGDIKEDLDSCPAPLQTIDYLDLDVDLLKRVAPEVLPEVLDINEVPSEQNTCPLIKDISDDQLTPKPLIICENEPTPLPLDQIESLTVEEAPSAPYPGDPCTTDNVSPFHNIDIPNLNTTFQLPEIQLFDSNKDIPLAGPIGTDDAQTRDNAKPKKLTEHRGRKRQEGGLKIKDKHYKCKVCFTWFLTLGELNFHKLSHNPSPPPTCYMCVQRKFSSREQLRDHLREKHTKNKAGIWTCGMCLKEISDVWMYNEHLREHATQFARKGQSHSAILGSLPGSGMQESAVKNFITSIMQRRPSKASRESSKVSNQEKPAVVETTGQEVRTTEVAQPKVVKPKGNIEKVGKPSTLTPVEVLHKTETAPKNVEMHPNCKDPSRDCHHCGKQFPKPFKLQRHLVVHNLNKMFLCHKCPVTYQEPQELKEHLKSEHEEVDELDSKHTTLYTCELCADVMHVIKKSFICSTCNYTFSKKEQFDRHMEKHLSGGNKIFKFRGVLRPIKTSASKENDECELPASKKRKILTDSLQENSSDSGIASIASLHLNQNVEMPVLKPSVHTTEDSTQTSAGEYHTENDASVKTEEMAEEYSDMLVELEHCTFHLGSEGVSTATPKTEDIVPSPSSKLPVRDIGEADGKSFTDPCDVKEEDDPLESNRAEEVRECFADAKQSTPESSIQTSTAEAEEKKIQRRDATASDEELYVSLRENLINSSKTPDSHDLHQPPTKHKASTIVMDQMREDKQGQQSTSTHSYDNKQKDKASTPKPSESTKHSSKNSPRAMESTPVHHTKLTSQGLASSEDKDSARREQKKRKEMRLPHSLHRVSSPATRENLGVDVKARNKFRPSKCESPAVHRKSEGPSDYPVLSSVRDDVVSNKIVSKHKTSGSLGLQPKRSFLDNCIPKKAEIVHHVNGDYKAKKGPLGRALHPPVSKVSAPPMNNSLNKSRPKTGVRSMESHSYRTAESQNNLLSQLFGQKLTSFKIPLRKDTSESIN
ncbi:unnamed protein product [Coregonus sp. 'balchen']|nr:unnamed protein product [Coregonus sp. 'balchen']